MKTIRTSIALVGCGYWGPNLARNFHQIRECRLACVCDTDPARMEAIGMLDSTIGCFTTFDEMLEEGNFDAVVIATPLRQHFPVARKALLAGKHVMVEKAMAASSDECTELMDLAADRRLTLMVGHTFLYSAHVRMIDRLIKSGEIGTILHINSQRLNLGRFHKDINVVWDLAPHDLSIILHLLGRTPEVVNCQGSAHVTPGVEDVANLSLAFSGGQFATIQSSWLEPRKARCMTIVGTRGMIIYDDVEPTEKIRVYEMKSGLIPHCGGSGEFNYSYDRSGNCPPGAGHTEPLRTMCRHFLDCILHGTRPLSSGEIGLEVVRILEACSRSLAQRGAGIELGATTAPARGSLVNPEHNDLENHEWDLGNLV